MTFQVMPMQVRTLSWWRDEADQVDMEPIYQRKGRIWSESQKQYLIDSILNGFDIPKLYFADFTFLDSGLNATKRKYAVIDGKQRLEAIYDFFEDRITLPKGFQYFENAELRLGGYSYSDLAKNFPKVARKFDNSSLTVMSVITDDDSKINELFVRLNTSQPLTGAELRNAMLGKIPELIRQLAQHDFFTSRIRFSVTRSQDRNTAAKFLLLEHRGTIVDTKKAQLDALVKEADELDSQQQQDDDVSELQDILVTAVEETENDEIERSGSKVRVVLDKLAGIFTPSDPLLRQQAQIVVIYWMVREMDPAELKKVRPFLVRFDEARQANRSASRDITGITDQELDEFELMARTSNDAYSIRRRVEIMQERFKAFIP